MMHYPLRHPALLTELRVTLPHKGGRKMMGYPHRNPEVQMGGRGWVPPRGGRKKVETN